MSSKESNRRDFIRNTGAIAAGAAALNAVLPSGAYAQGSDEIRVGVMVAAAVAVARRTMC